jgi:hypothetical protein
MAKFYGKVGFGETVEKAPGVWDDVITERPYFGDVTRNTRKLQDGTSVNSNITVNNIINIVADEYANAHIFAIRYVEWMGALWTVTTVEVQSPRLLLILGSVYNGPQATSSGSP